MISDKKKSYPASIRDPFVKDRLYDQSAVRSLIKTLSNGDKDLVI